MRSQLHGYKILLPLPNCLTARPTVVYAECLLPWTELSNEIFCTFYSYQDYILQVPTIIEFSPWFEIFIKIDSKEFFIKNIPSAENRKKVFKLRTFFFHVFFFFFLKKASDFDRNKISFFPLFQLFQFSKETVLHWSHLLHKFRYFHLIICIYDKIQINIQGNAALLNSVEFWCLTSAGPEFNSSKGIPAKNVSLYCCEPHVPFQGLQTMHSLIGFLSKLIGTGCSSHVW